MIRTILIILLLVVPGPAIFCQRVQWQSFAFTEENDFLNILRHGIDRYYTQGLKFEFTYRVSKRSFFEKLVIPISPSATNVYSISTFQKIYTPGRVDKYFYAGDHPYGSSLVLSEGLISYDSARQLRLSTRLDAGMIGPATLGKQTQDFFHKMIHGDGAVGWETQLRNDLYLNYFVKVEKAITSPERKFRIEWKADFNLGTALISTVPGLNFEYGTGHDRSKKNAWQIFLNSELRVVAYNAMLQGGVLNQNFSSALYSQFFLEDIKLLIYSQSMGIRYRHNRLEAMFRQVVLTPEFSGQRAHYYGTVWVSFPLGRN